MTTRIGDYVVEDFGATGVVRCAATHVLLPRRAIIELLDAGAPRSRAIAMMRQACVLEALHHPGVPRVYECGLLDGRPWVAHELIEGVSLEEQHRARTLTGGEVVALIDHVAAILEHAHARGVLHRDITPRVIFACPGRVSPVVLDGWTSACTLDSELPPPLRGTPRYRALELMREDAADGRADVFALGAVAHEALTGSVPTPGRPASGVRPELAHLLEAMTAIDPTARPTAAEVRMALRGLHPAAAPAEPRARTRWTPPWGQGDQPPPPIVEIRPRRQTSKPDPRD